MVEQHAKALVPEIRFAGFTDPWEQRKLGDITEILSGARVHKGEWRTEGIPFYRSSDVMAAFNNTDNERVFISQELFKELSARSGVPEQGDVMVTGGGSVGTPYIVPDNKPLYTKDADLIWIKHCADISPEFLYYFFVAPVFRSYIASISHVGTIAHYTIEQVKDTSVGLPTQMAEQKMVGVFFKQLDSLITLHQRKYDKLCVLKKSMLDKMFPKGGSLYPEIRFAGFTDPWEQRKLGELFEEHSEKDRDDLPALTIIQGGGTVHRDESNRNLQFDRSSLSNYKVVDTGDFIVHLRSFEGGLEKATCYGLVSPAYHIFRGKNVDSDFYYLYFRSKRFIDVDLKPHVYGIRDGRSIDIEGMKTIFIPWTNLAEQRQIGAFFDRLDSLITLHQRKLELLRNIKKSMLDKMFV